MPSACLPAEETLPWTGHQKHKPGEEQSGQQQWHDKEYETRTKIK